MTGFITLGIGAGSNITQFICVGVIPGAEPAAAVVASGGGIALIPGRVRRTWRTERDLLRPPVVAGIAQVAISRPDLAGTGTVTPVITGAGAVAFTGRVMAHASFELCGDAAIMVPAGVFAGAVEAEDPYAQERLIDEGWLLHELLEA